MPSLFWTVWYGVESTLAIHSTTRFPGLSRPQGFVWERSQLQYSTKVQVCQENHSIRGLEKHLYLLTARNGCAILAPSPKKDIALRLRGITLQLAYRLRRHLWGVWPLSHWLGLILLTGSLAALIHWWPVFWPALFLGSVFLFHVGLHSWAARSRYVHFETITENSVPFPEPPAPPPLRKEELVPVRVSGLFAVEGRERRYMDIRADFETVGTREHIVLGCLFPSRFLRLGRWPLDEVGWWYIFFQPAMIRDLSLGQLCFGAQPRLAIRIIYAPDEETRETAYLTSEDLTTLRRVWDDLRKDSPK